MFVLESGVKARGWFLREDADTLRIVDAACGTPVLQKRSVQPSRLVVHGRPYEIKSRTGRIPWMPASLDALSEASLADLAQAAKFEISLAEARTLLVSGESATFRKGNGLVVEGVFVVAQPGCLLLEDATGAFGAHAFADIDLGSLKSSAAPIRVGIQGKETPSKAPAPGWPGLKEHTRAHGYRADRIFKSYGAQGRRLPAQGFRLTIAAADSTFEHVASVVLPVLVRRRMAHKVVGRFEDFLKEGQTRQAGKLVTIFATSAADAASVAAELEGLLARDPPLFWAIQGEQPVGKNPAVRGIVTARYMPFTWEYGGELKKPDGAFVPEIRGAQWKPDWVRDPF